MTMTNSFPKRMENYIRASFPCIAVQTAEEPRVMADILAVAKRLGERAVYTWSCIDGLQRVNPTTKDFKDTQDLGATLSLLLEYLRKGAKELEASRIIDVRRNDSMPAMNNAMIVLRDPHTWPFERDPLLARGLRDVLAVAPLAGTTIIVTAPRFSPHPTIERMVTVLDYSLPDPKDLRLICEETAKSAKEGGADSPTLKGSDDVVRALGGLSTTEAEHALALSVVETGGFDAPVIYREKVAAVKRSGLLELIEADPRGLEAIGGLDILKGWILKRREAFSQRAADFGLPSPKGIMLIGVPGTGKSLASKAIGTALGCPTLKLDIGSMFNSLVGESEERIRDALKLAEAVSPCVLFLDEIDKGLAGASGGGGGDSGVTKRVFGTIITWMQERSRPVFIVASANDVTNLPPELLRKGRFDELFALDLPGLRDRTAIYGIQLKKYGRDPSKFDLQRCASSSELFTGSEIEAVIIEALYTAFDANREPTTEDLVSHAQALVPLAKTASEQIAAIRQWAQTRARFASTPDEEVPGIATAGRRRISNAN
jgi:hypothetical protein